MKILCCTTFILLFINLKWHRMQATKFHPHASTAANDDDEITKHFIQITSDQLPEWRTYSWVLPESILRSHPKFCSAMIHCNLCSMIFCCAETCAPAFFPVFADYFSHTAASTIFAKYRMITRRGNMSIFMYDYYFLFYLIAGWIIMLKNGKRESLNSFKSCKIFRFFTREWSLAHIRWLKLILMSHLSLCCFILPLLVEFQQPKALAGEL